MNNTGSCFLGLALLAASTASADVLVSSSHQPIVQSQKTEFVRSCLEVIREHWGDAGLVLRQKASHGYSATGARVVSVGGTVWQNGKRVEVFHQCSNEPGSRQLALYVEGGEDIAKVDHESK